jgi:hypothetical protein
MAQENRTCQKVVGEMATQNMGLLVAHASRMLRLVSGRQTRRENMIMVERHSRALGLGGLGWDNLALDEVEERLGVGEIYVNRKNPVKED